MRILSLITNKKLFILQYSWIPSAGADAKKVILYLYTVPRLYYYYYYSLPG